MTASRSALALVLALGCGVLPAALAQSPMLITDDRGRQHAFADKLRRMVTLAPHLAEIAFAAGAGEALIGVSSATDHPEAAMRLPVVASHGRADPERVLRARPDGVLAWLSGTPRRELERLERLGIPVVGTEVKTLTDIPRLLRLIARLAGTSDIAEPAAQLLDEQIADLFRRAGRHTLPVFVEIWHEPLMSVNGEHLISDVLRACGARNVFASAPRLSFAVSREQLLKAQPAAMVLNALPGGEAAARERWSDPLLPAARHRQLYAIDPRIMHSQGPRLIAAARALCTDLERARAGKAPRARS
jgi:iron complex transport system substrate-binding protein